MDLAARDAIAAQPTGHTLETTQVKLKVGGPVTFMCELVTSMCGPECVA